MFGGSHLLIRLVNLWRRRVLAAKKCIKATAANMAQSRERLFLNGVGCCKKENLHFFHLVTNWTEFFSPTLFPFALLPNFKSEKWTWNSVQLNLEHGSLCYAFVKRQLFSSSEHIFLCKREKSLEILQSYLLRIFSLWAKKLCWNETKETVLRLQKRISCYSEN